MQFNAQIKLGLTLASVTILAGCSMMTASNAPSCVMFQPIYWSADDTPETIAQVKELNAVWVENCR